MVTGLTEAQYNRAQKTLARFKQMLPGLTATARALTGNPKAAVVMAEAGGPSSAYTDGTRIYLTPPLALGDDLSHVTTDCDTRGAHGGQLCPACALREDIMGGLYHEMAHISFGTFALRTPQATRMVQNEAMDLGTNYGREIALRLLKLRPDVVAKPHVAMAMVSPYLPIIVNSIEDVRVDTLQGQARAGVPAMRRYRTTRLLAEGMETADGKVMHWREQPLDAQAIMSLVLMGSKTLPSGSLEARIEQEVWGDEELQRITERAATAKDSDESHVLGFKCLARLRELGYCLSERDPEEPEPEEEDEPEENPEPESGDSGEGEEESEAESEKGDGESGEESEPESEESSDDSSDSSNDESSNETDDSSEEGDAESGSSGDAGDDDAEEGDADAAPSSGGDTSPDDTQSATPAPDADAEEGDDAPAEPVPGDDGETADDDSSDNGGDDWSKEEIEYPSPTGEERGTPEEAEAALENFLHAGGGWGGDDNSNSVDADLLRETATRLESFDSYSPSVSRVTITEAVTREKAWSPRGTGVAPYRQFQPKVSELAQPLALMRRVFDANKRDKHTGGLKSGRVNARALGQRAWGDDERLFKKKERVTKRSYFVLIGVDVSGSTSDRGIIKQIKRAAFAQAELCARLGIEFAMYGHSGEAPSSSKPGMSVSIFPIKHPNEKWSEETKERLGMIGSYSGNLDGHTLEFYRKVLDRRTETDRILLYFTDGEMPAMNYADELNVLQREIKVCKSRGYVLLGVGIGTDSPKKHGLDTVRVDGMADIGATVRHLERAIISR